MRGVKMSDKNKISRLYSKGVKLNSAINQSRAENKNKQELIDKLTEQNKMLREALESICRMDNYVYADVVARKALEATK
jgi:cell division protein FtsB